MVIPFNTGDDAPYYIGDWIDKRLGVDMINRVKIN